MEKQKDLYKGLKKYFGFSAFKGNLSVLQILFQACLGQFNPQQR